MGFDCVGRFVLRFGFTSCRFSGRGFGCGLWLFNGIGLGWFTLVCGFLGRWFAGDPKILQNFCSCSVEGLEVLQEINNIIYLTWVFIIVGNKIIQKGIQ